MIWHINTKALPSFQKRGGLTRDCLLSVRLMGPSKVGLTVCFSHFQARDVNLTQQLGQRLYVGSVCAHHQDGTTDALATVAALCHSRVRGQRQGVIPDKEGKLSQRRFQISMSSN
ncbi:hypothetical protein AVEN_46931-1 [Araneus ventricosus]|uniref:Uncharacterized protein n=1 Tax=Araneus ventricosus TaxID=182803 RepID=A0A4Y2FMQ5_ARAVE|nr:hypothetical protein AVEN_46931-1 [Araneus ventricosus]